MHILSSYYFHYRPCMTVISYDPIGHSTHSHINFECTQYFRHNFFCNKKAVMGNFILLVAFKHTHENKRSVEHKIGSENEEKQL